MPDAPPLALGLVGFGRLAREYYLPALRRIDGVRLAAIADSLVESRAKAARRLPAAEVHDDHRAMLDHGGLDALLVASPPSTHLAVWNDAVARALPVFMEKPFVLASQLGEVVRGGTGGRVMVDFNRRFWPPYRRVAEILRTAALGRPVEADFRLHSDVVSWSTVTRHRFSSGEGGVLHDLGCHAIDLAADLLGEEPSTVAAEAATERWPEDRLRMTIYFADGSRFRCDLAWSARNRETLDVRGPAGALRLADPNAVLHVGRDGSKPLRALETFGDAAAFGWRAIRRDVSMARFSIARALASFVEAVRLGRPFSPGFEDAVRNVRWLDAAVRSSNEGGRPVSPA